MLVNKFRNKYNINTTDDFTIDKMIQEEVGDLLAQGSAYEANLYKLDKKLEANINQMRAGKEIKRAPKRAGSIN